MAYSVDQIEKHTLLTRLSVAIYRMTDEQLKKLLGLLEQSLGGAASYSDNALAAASASADGIPAMRRQMTIARLFILIKQMDKDALLQCLRRFKHPDFQWVREFPRLPCYLLVDFATEGKVYRSCIRDISASGVFIETSDSFEKGQSLALCFALAESNETLPFKIKGRVSRVYPDGIGVQYENVTQYQRDIIDTLLKKQN